MRLEFESNVSTPSFTETVVETGSSQTSELLRRGIKAAQEGNRAAARHLLLRVTETEPHNENAWLWLASISEYPEELLIFLNNVLEVNPENTRAVEWKKATKTLLAKTFVQRGIDASKENRLDFAKQCFYQAVAHDDANEMAWLWLASVSDFAEEKSLHLNRVLSINPENQAAQTALQTVHRETAQMLLQTAQEAAFAGDTATANDLLTEIFQKSPNFEEAWVFKSHLAGGFDEKIRCYERILEINPHNETANSGLNSLRGFMPKAVQNESLSQPSFNHRDAPTAAFADENPSDNQFADDDRNADSLFTPVDEPAAYTAEEKEVKESSAAQMPAETAEYFSSQSDTPFAAIETDQHSADAEQHSADHLSVVPHSLPASETLPDADPVFAAEETPADEPIESETFSEEAYSEPVYESAESPADTQPADFFAADETEHSLTPQPAESEIYAENASADADFFSTTQFSTPAEPQPVNSLELNGASEDDSAHSVEEIFAPETPAPAEEETAEPANFFGKPAEDLQYNDFAYQVNTEVQPFEPTAAEAEEEIFLPEDAVQPAEFFHETHDVAAGAGETPDADESAEHFAAADNDPNAQNAFDNFAAERTDAGLTIAAAQSNAAPARARKTEMASCPFCSGENDAQAFSCQSCRAVLSLSDLESLLGSDADRSVLQSAVSRMELEKNLRGFDDDELFTLGVGHINLKNLRQGYNYLQQTSAAQPNDVLLASQVHQLAIRLADIERQDEIQDAMPKERTILVVDDSPTVRKLIAGKLEKSGHEVVCAVDGMDALSKLNEVVPDLILLDITMPKMDGYQVCKLIRNNAVTKNIPVVMISGKDGFFDKVRGRMAGTTGYITKPFGPETLMKALDAYIKNGDAEITAE